VNNNRLIIAIVVLAVLAGVVASTLRSREATVSVPKPTASLPKLKQEEITKIQIENPEKKLSVTLVKRASPAAPAEAKDADAGAAAEKTADSWRLSAPLDAKPDGAAIDSLLEKLTNLEVVSVAATRKENHEKVGVDPAHAIHVKAYGSGDKLLLDAFIGASKSSGTMVRTEGEDSVLAVRGSIRYAFDKELKGFRDRAIVDLDPEALAALNVSSPKGNFKFEKAEAGWVQAKGEKAIKDFSANKVASLGSSFARLRASDFAAPDASAESTGLNAPAAKLVLTPKQGEPVTIELGKQVEGAPDYYLRASGNPVIYRVSKFTGDRMQADAAAFSEPPKKPGEESAPSMGMGKPIAGGGDLPPEILKQLQQQMGHGMPPH
jgi:hypothetical protein